jgi:hypothetical protein
MAGPAAGLVPVENVKVFGCRPLTNHATPCGGRRTKTSKGGNRGRDGRAAPQVPGLWGFECREWRDVVAAGELADGVCCGRSGCRSVRRPLSGADRWWRAGEVTVNDGHVPRAVVASEWPEARMIISQSDEAGERDHDVSILIATSGAVGRYRGKQPRAKVSMTIIRPPQHGQGCESAFGWSAAVRSESLGSG